MSNIFICTVHIFKDVTDCILIKTALFFQCTTGQWRRSPIGWTDMWSSASTYPPSSRPKSMAPCYQGNRPIYEKRNSFSLQILSLYRKLIKSISVF